MTTLTVSSVGRRALPRERPPHSTFAVAALGLAVLAAVAIAIALAMVAFSNYSATIVLNARSLEREWALIQSLPIRDTQGIAYRNVSQG